MISNRRIHCTEGIVHDNDVCIRPICKTSQADASFLAATQRNSPFSHQCMITRWQYRKILNNILNNTALSIKQKSKQLSNSSMVYIQPKKVCLSVVAIYFSCVLCFATVILSLLFSTFYFLCCTGRVKFWYLFC